MESLPTYYGQFQFEKDEKSNEQFWKETTKQFGLHVVETALWYTPWYGDDEPMDLTAPPNLLAHVPDAQGEVVGVLRLCWIGAEDDQLEIQFQGNGESFRDKVQEICDHVGGEIIEGPPG